MGYDTLVKIEDSKAKGKRYTAIFRDSKMGRKRVNFGDEYGELHYSQRSGEEKKIS